MPEVQGNNLCDTGTCFEELHVTGQMLAAMRALFCADMMMKPSFTPHSSGNPHMLGLGELCMRRASIW